MWERTYQARLIQDLHKLFPDCIVLKNDSSYRQGMPDLLILYNDRWAALEVKRSKDAPVTPNQGYYIDTMNEMSYASFIYPENEDEVLDDLQHTFSVTR